MAAVRIFHIESPSPIDMLDGRAEGPVLRAIAPLIGHTLHTQVVTTRRQLEEALQFLGTMPNPDDRQRHLPVVLHISAHGYEDGSGIGVGADVIEWSDFGDVIRPFVAMGGDYPGKRIVVLSACFADKQTLTAELTRAGKRGRAVPLDYLFCTQDAVGWHHAAVAWTAFYYLLPTMDLNDRSDVQAALAKIQGLGTTLHYWRWDGKRRKYRHHCPTESDGS